MIDLAFLAAYWSIGQLVASFTIILHLAGALALGLLVGYERSYHGRAAGMRTYGIVCMASAALTIIGAYPHAWYGAHVGDMVRPSVAAVMSAAGPDPTRIIQGVVTGIGFLGAGVIMREGFNISGLTTAASLWSSSVIGILIGIGFYMAAIMMALLVALSMIWIPRMEEWVPSRHAIAIVLRFAPGFIPDETRCGRGDAPRLRDRRRFAGHHHRARRGRMAFRRAVAQQEERDAAVQAGDRAGDVRRGGELPAGACAELNFDGGIRCAARAFPPYAPTRIGLCGCAALTPNKKNAGGQVSARRKEGSCLRTSCRN
jgi:putative Mg2+ transporter-C (MgtC) family protein